VVELAFPASGAALEMKFCHWWSLGDEVLPVVEPWRRGLASGS